MSAIVLKSASIFAFASLVAFGCNPEAEEADGSDQADAQAASTGPAKVAPEFSNPIPLGNGRGCATCHVPEKNFTISPAEAEARFQANSNDPLFRSIDADDFASDFTTVRTKGLFRVTIPLPANVSLVGSSAREVKLWRAVPPIFNVKLTGPFTHDGRASNLFDQAQGAALEHSRPKDGKLPGADFFNKIVTFQQAQFSSAAVKGISDLIDAGQAPPPVGQDYDGPLNALEQDGFAAFQEHCLPCHGGNSRGEINTAIFPGGFFTAFVSELNRANLPVLDFDVENPDGTVSRVSSPDPGRLLVTGKASDANFFDVTPLRGISKTAPYFHDNSARNFDELFTHYNILFTAFGIPTIRPEQVVPLTAYLNRL